MTTAVQTTHDTETRWGAHVPQVRKALKFIKSKGAVTPDELVEWDATHGRRLFTWTDETAADEWRRHEARLFFNRFRGVFEGMRVRAFIHVDEDEDHGIDRGAYVTVETISRHAGMRDQVIQDIIRRMASLASELKMWKLGEHERAKILARLQHEME